MRRSRRRALAEPPHEYGGVPAEGAALDAQLLSRSDSGIDASAAWVDVVSSVMISSDAGSWIGIQRMRYTSRRG